MGIFAKLFGAEPDRSVFIHPVKNGMQMRIDFKTMECELDPDKDHWLVEPLPLARRRPFNVRRKDGKWETQTTDAMRRGAIEEVSGAFEDLLAGESAARAGNSRRDGYIAQEETILKSLSFKTQEELIFHIINRTSRSARPTGSR